MTPQERQILNEAEEQVFEIASQSGEGVSRGTRQPPLIEATDSTLDGQLFGLDLGGQPGTSQTDNTPGGSAPPPPPDPGMPTGACCVPGFGCVILTATQCTYVLGTYQGDGTVCSPDPC